MLGIAKKKLGWGDLFIAVEMEVFTITKGSFQLVIASGCNHEKHICLELFNFIISELWLADKGNFGGAFHQNLRVSKSNFSFVIDLGYPLIFHL